MSQRGRHAKVRSGGGRLRKADLRLLGVIPLRIALRPGHTPLWMEGS